MSEITPVENLYLLLGQIPKEKMYSTGGSLIGSILIRDEEEYIRSCFYQKGKIGENGIILGSYDNNDSAPHYYFSYAEGEEQDIRESFISMQEFLSSSTYINRRFKRTEESLSELLDGVMTDSQEDKKQEEYFLICALGDKALIKKETFFTSGYEIIDTSLTPLKSENFEFTSDVEKTDIAPHDIIEEIKNDLKGDTLESSAIYTP